MVAVRSQREIDCIRESSRIVYETLCLLEDKIQPGVRGEDLDRFAEDYICSQRAVPAFKGYLGYPATLCISINDVVVHGIPNGHLFEEGDIVSIDCGAVKNGYYGDSARTFPVGKISDNLQKLMEVTETSLYLGIKEAKAGNWVSDIGHAIQHYVEGFGFSVVRELVGHGIGTQLHENPQVPNYGDPGHGIELKPGMCIAIEPMINAGKKDIFTQEDGWSVCTRDGMQSAHFEHTIVVTEEGGKILSNGVQDD